MMMIMAKTKRGERRDTGRRVSKNKCGGSIIWARLRGNSTRSANFESSRLSEDFLPSDPTLYWNGRWRRIIETTRVRLIAWMAGGLSDATRRDVGGNEEECAADHANADANWLRHLTSVGKDGIATLNYVLKLSQL